METVQFEPMSVGRIFDRAFTIYRNNFLRFIAIVAVIEVPLALLSTATSSWTQTKVARQRTFLDRMKAAPDSTRPVVGPYEADRAAPSPAGVLGRILTLLLRGVGVMLCQAALIKSVSETYLGNEIAIGQAYRFILPKALTLIAAAICVTLVTWLGFLLLIVPGVIFSLWFSMTTPVIVVEGHSATGGMSRSRALATGNLGKVFAVGLLAGLIMFLAIISLSFVAGMIAGLVSPGNGTTETFLAQLAATIGQILIMPVSVAATILLYYDLRIRKEGFDLQMLAQSMTSGQGEFRAA